MRFEPWLAVMVVLFAGAARAEHCTAKTAGIDDIVAALNGAPSCDSAMKLFAACGYGASADVQFGAAVEKKCEAEFIDRLELPQRQAYRRELALCDRKYRNKPGTMYLSAMASCRAETAQRYAQQGQKAAGRVR